MKSNIVSSVCLAGTEYLTDTFKLMNKKLALALLLIFSLTAISTAQEKETKKRDAAEKLTAEQRNALQLKRITLHLDLTASQQKEMASLIAEQNAAREAKMAERKAKKEAQKPLSPDEKFAMANKMLDEKIELKAKMKKILTKEQMEKWEANHEKRNRHAQKMRKHHQQKANNEVSE